MFGNNTIDRPLLKEIIPGKIFEWKGRRFHKSELDIPLSAPIPTPDTFPFDKGDIIKYEACQFYRFQRDIFYEGKNKNRPVTNIEAEEIIKIDEPQFRWCFVEHFRGDDNPAESGICLVDFIYPKTTPAELIPDYSILSPRHLIAAQNKFMKKSLRPYPTSDSSFIGELNLQFKVDYLLRNRGDTSLILLDDEDDKQIDSKLEQLANLAKIK